MLSYEEDFTTKVKAIKVTKNSKAETVVVINLKKPAKFYSILSASWDNLNNVRMNGSMSNIFTDIGVMNGDKIIKELDKDQIGQMFRLFRNASLTVEVSMSDTGSISEVVFDYDLSLKERVLDGLTQFNTGNNDGL